MFAPDYRYVLFCFYFFALEVGVAFFTYTIFFFFSRYSALKSVLYILCFLWRGGAGVAAGLSGAEGAANPDKTHVRRDRAAARAFQRPGRPRQARDSRLLQTRPSPDGPGKEDRERGIRPRGP